MKLEGEIAIVTGAGQGLGRVIALALAKEGADIVVNDINIVSAESVAKELKMTGRRALALQADVTKSKEVEAMVKTALRELGKIDILVNNAGGSARERCSEFRASTEEVWDFVIGRNLKGVLVCTRAVINHMIERQSGKIVSIASIVGINGGALQADYSAAKAGIVGFSKALAKEVGIYGINVNCISPGTIFGTVATQKAPKEVVDAVVSKQILKRRGEPQDIANIVTFLVSDAASFITGQNYAVCGGASIT